MFPESDSCSIVKGRCAIIILLGNWTFLLQKLLRKNFQVSYIGASSRMRFYSWETVSSRSESDRGRERERKIERKIERSRSPRITLTRLNESTPTYGFNDRHSPTLLPRYSSVLSDHHPVSVLRRRKCCYPSSIHGM